MRFLTIGCALLGWIGAAQAQKAARTVLPIGDLCGAVLRAEPYVSLPGIPGARWLQGEESWYVDAETASQLRYRGGYFGGKDLCGLLAQLGGLDTDSLRTAGQGNWLSVPQERAEAVRALLEGVRQRLPALVRVDLQLVATFNGASQVLLARTLECRSGAVEVTSALTDSTTVATMQVEIACNAEIADPTVRPLRHGAMVVLRPLVSPSGDAALLEVLARTVEPAGNEPLETGIPAMGPLGRASMRVAEHATVLRAGLGDKLEQKWTGPLGTEYALVMHTHWTVPPAVRPGSHELEVVTPMGAFTGFRSIAERIEGDEPKLAEGLAVQLIDFDGLLTSGSDPEHYVALDALAEQVRAGWTGLFAAAVQGAALEISVLDAPIGVECGADGAAPPGATRLAAARVACVDDTWAAVTSYQERSYIRDWQVEVAQDARIPSPQVARTHDGICINLRRRGDRVELDGELAIRAPSQTQRVLLAPALTSGSSTKLQRDVPEVAVLVEAPVVHRLPVRGRLLLKAGTPSVLRQAAPGLGAGRELVVVVRPMT
jgi:hypothetical protein